MSGLRLVTLTASVHLVALAAGTLAPVAGLVAPARADTLVEAAGSAAVQGGDTSAARARALDDALRQAVDQAVGTLVAPAERSAKGEVIKKRILRRARSYVPTFRIVDEGEASGFYRVHLNATIAVTTLSRDLAASGVALATADAGGTGTSAPTPDTTPTAAIKPRFAVLLVARAGERSYATFGTGGDAGPAAAALEAELRARGFEVVSAAGRPAPVAIGGAAGPLPLDDAQAAELARAAGATAVVIMGIEATDAGKIRGARVRAVEATALVRVLELPPGQPATLVAEGRAQTFAFAPEAAAAGDEGIRAAGTRALARVLPRVVDRFRQEAVPDRGVVVRVRGVDGWAPIAALGKTLARTPGIESVLPRRFARGEVSFLVRGGVGAGHVAQAVSAAPTSGARVTARASGPQTVVVDRTPEAATPETPGGPIAPSP